MSRWSFRAWIAPPRGGWKEGTINAPDSKAAIEAAHKKHPRAGEIQVRQARGSKAELETVEPPAESNPFL